MKVVTLEIEEELYEDFKLFRNGYIKGFKHSKGQNQSHSSKRQVNWHEITLSQLMVERPDLVAAMDEAKGSFGNGGASAGHFAKIHGVEGEIRKECPIILERLRLYQRNNLWAGRGG